MFVKCLWSCLCSLPQIRSAGHVKTLTGSSWVGEACSRIMFESSGTCWEPYWCREEERFPRGGVAPTLTHYPWWQLDVTPWDPGPYLVVEEVTNDQSFTLLSSLQPFLAINITTEEC